MSYLEKDSHCGVCVHVNNFRELEELTTSINKLNAGSAAGSAAGSVAGIGAVISCSDARYLELDAIITSFATTLSYLPVILLTDIETSDSSTSEVLKSIIFTLNKCNWTNDKIRSELRKLLVTCNCCLISDQLREIRETIDTELPIWEPSWDFNAAFC